VRLALKALESTLGSGAPASKTTQLRLAVTPTFSREILLPRLALFRHAYPDVELILQVSIPLLNVTAEGADLEIRFGTGGWAGLDETRVLADEVFPVCSPEYLHEFGPFDGFDTVAGISRARLIRSPLEPWRTWFQHCGINLPEPREGAQFNDVGLTLDAAVAGFGVALTRSRLGVAWLDSGRLIRLSPRAVRSPHSHYLCWKPGTLERWECAAFLDWLKQSLA
jgi:LysR family transcriptional regulator, glycine cleavage system transcriptional activator